MTQSDRPDPLGYHATTIAVGDAAAMIVGPSGSGKSSLALELIGLGASLVADDYSRVRVGEDGPVVMAPDRLQGVIEARGIGLINVPWKASAHLQLVVDLSKDEVDRLPPSRRLTNIGGYEIDLVLRVDAPYFACALYHLLKSGRHDGTS
ncbi:aldolase [Aliiroseovarius zhejiangensis]|uniref:Aldolase n=1 Tax=Aliiroseovarius zhejiangensis TaxID=1632025 RepID=A0ABQ3J7N7_9RHOB|nr:HPr kinase/phosphatase C-terminal domain-containing protein [Aliiroseovarius zhejiangensis]GHF04447.1 aldolase [Aliiroseovarius zhejiangensis]